MRKQRAPVVRRVIVAIVVATVGASGVLSLLAQPAPHASARTAVPSSSLRQNGQAQELMKRISLAEFVKDPKKVASLRRAVKKMRGLPSTDPRSWIFQANIHWRPLFPVYVYQQAGRSSDPAQQLFRDAPGATATPDVFNQCPHGNWWFLPWHRAYLHHFERILRWAAEDPTLTLPYWDYTDPDQRGLPEAFRVAKVNGEDNPLYLPAQATFTNDRGELEVFPMRDAPLLRGQNDLSKATTGLQALNIRTFTNPPALGASSGFGSPQACDPTCSCGSGALEATPHNQVHLGVGGSQATAGGSVRLGFMGDVSTAARDPVFWVHHANIDRLWASWINLKGGRRNPEDPVWLKQSFTFVDLAADGKPTFVEVTVEDVLTTEQLGYVYDTLAQAPVDVVKADAPAPAGRIFQPLAATPPPLRKGKELPHAMPAQAPGISLTTAKARSFPVPLVRGVDLERLQVPDKATPGAAPGNLLLSLEGVDFEQTPAVSYEVYFGLPKNSRATPDSPYYVGAMTFFGTRHPPVAGGHGKHRAPLYFKFLIPPQLRELLAEKKGGPNELQVTFVPQTGTVPAPNQAALPPPPDRPGITIRQVRLLLVH
jgi:tyrosinase